MDQLSVEASAHLRHVFRRNRRIVQAVIAGGFLFVGFLIVAFGEHWSIVIAMWAGYVFVTWLLAYRLWRCPRCALLFGRPWRKARCPECGLVLDGEPGAG